MKLGNYLEETRNMEHERTALVKERSSLLTATFEDKRIGAQATTDEIDRIRQKFLSDKATRVIEINNQLDILTATIVSRRTKMNSENTRIGITPMLIEIKQLRTELATLDKVLNADRYDRVDQDIIELAHMRDRLRFMEARKRSLEAQIRSLNYSSDI